MTREEIEKAYDDKYECQRPSGVYERQHLIGMGIAIDFALDMVRRHNEELQEKVKTNGPLWLDHLRELKP